MRLNKITNQRKNFYLQPYGGSLQKYHLLWANSSFIFLPHLFEMMCFMSIIRKNMYDHNKSPNKIQYFWFVISRWLCGRSVVSAVFFLGYEITTEPTDQPTRPFNLPTSFRSFQSIFFLKPALFLAKIFQTGHIYFPWLFGGFFRKLSGH